MSTCPEGLQSATESMCSSLCIRRTSFFGVQHLSSTKQPPNYSQLPVFSLKHAEHTFVFRSLNLKPSTEWKSHKLRTSHSSGMHVLCNFIFADFKQLEVHSDGTERGIKLWEYVCVCKRNWQFQQMVSCTPQCQSPRLDAHWFLRDTRLCSDTLTCLEVRGSPVNKRREEA